MSSKKTGLSLDFIVYLGDPDGGAEALTSAEAVKKHAEHRDALRFDHEVYGAIRFLRGGQEVGERQPDPILKLVTKLVRSLPYIFEGETETVLLTESEHGFVFERSAEDVMVSFFKGIDPFEPEDYILEQESMPLEQFGEQVIAMADRLLELLKKDDPGRVDSHDYGHSLKELLDTARGVFRSFRLEKEHGIRR